MSISGFIMAVRPRPAKRGGVMQDRGVGGGAHPGVLAPPISGNRGMEMSKGL